MNLFLQRIVVGLLLVACLAGPVPASGQGDPGARIAGEAALADGFYEVAQKQFETYIASTDDPAEKAAGTLSLVQALVGRKAWDEATELLTARRPWVAGQDGEGAFLYWLARVDYAREDYAGALATLTELFPAYPTHPLTPSAMALAARCHIQLGTPQQAFTLFGEIANRFPDDPGAADNLLDWAGLLIQESRTEEAMKRLKALQTLAPQGPKFDEALLWQGEIAAGRKAWDDAAAPLQTLVDREAASAPLRHEAAMMLASVEGARTNYPAAMAAVQKALERVPSEEARIRANLEKGRLMILTGDSEAGLQLLRTTVVEMKSDQEAGTAQFQFAGMLHEQGLYAQAVGEYQAYLEAFSETGNPSLALEGKGWALWELGRYAEAAMAFDKASLAASDETRKAQNLLKASDAYFANEQYQKAHDSYAQFLSGFPGHAMEGQARYQSALCLVRKNVADKAGVLLRELLQDTSDPELAGRAGLLLATLSEEQRKWQEAIAVYDEIMERYTETSHFQSALHRRALARYRLGMFAEALADFQSLVQKFPDQDVAEQAFYMRGYCRYMLGESKDAVALAEEFLKQYPASRWAPQVIFWLADYHFNRNEYALAEQQYQRLAMEFGGSTYAELGLLEAARSAFYQEEYTRATDHVNELAKRYPASEHMPDARFLQGDALSERGEFGTAILTMEEIISKWPNSYLVALAHGRIGDFHLTLGADDKTRYGEAMKHFSIVYDSPKVDPDRRLQALYKIGKCQERAGDDEAAFETYTDVIYQTFATWSKGTPVGTVWFSRAAFAAGALKEKKKEWREAVRLYRRVADVGGAASDDAEQRIQKIRLEHFLIF